MKREILVVIAILMTVANTASADFVLGLQSGGSSTYGEINAANAALIAREGGEESGSAIGIFGQYRHILSNNVVIGAHLAYTGDSTEWKGSIPIDSGNFTNAKAEIDSVYDILGLVGYNGNKVIPFLMFGFSSMKLDGLLEGQKGGVAFSGKDDSTLTGWKLALGAEFPFNKNMVGHVMLHYADYGKESIGESDDGIELETKQTGIRFGVGYRF